MSQKVYLFSATPHSDVEHINSLDFDYFQPTIDFSQYNYLVLTSKKAVDALQYYARESYIHIPALCISTFTKEYYQSKGGVVLGIGGGIGSDLKQIIAKYPKETKWLYLRAREIAGSGFDTDEAIIYESRCSEAILNFKLEEKESCSLIFTSPSSIKCFLKNNKITVHQRVIVIGKTTAKSLPIGVKYLKAEENSIEACLRLTH